MGKVSFLSVIIALLHGATVFAQENAAGEVAGFELKWGGNLDFNYALTSNRQTAAQRKNGAINTFNSVYGYPIYNDQFTLNQAELMLSATQGQTSVNFTLGYGSGVSLTTGDYPMDGSTTLQNRIQFSEAYISQGIGDTGLKISAGKFVGHVGYEAFDNVDNWNYTRSYAWYLTPAYVTGIKGVYSFMEGKSNVGLHLINSTQLFSDEYDENNNKGIGAHASIVPMDGLSIYASYLNSKDIFLNVDRVYSWYQVAVTYTVMPGLDLAADYQLRTDDPSAEGAKENKAQTINLYAKYKMDKFGVALRFENFTDEDGTLAIYTPAPAKDKYAINSITGTLMYDVTSAVQTKLEYRYETADEKIYTGDDPEAQDAELEKSQNVIAAAVMVKF